MLDGYDVKRVARVRLIRVPTYRYDCDMSGPKASTSFRLSNETLELLARLARYYDIDRTAALTLALREKAYALGVAEPDSLAEVGTTYGDAKSTRRRRSRPPARGAEGRRRTK